MGWYVVIKTIKGHRYRYRQRTWREGDRVRTESVYVGPVGSGDTRGDGGGSRCDIRDEHELIDKIFDSASLIGVVEFPRKPWAGRYSSRGKFTPDRRLSQLAGAMRVVGLSRPWQGRGEHVRTDGAWYSRGKDVLQLPDHTRFVSNAEYTRVSLHELGHATGHQKRLSRSRETWSREGYAHEEMVADLSAHVVALRLGLPRVSVGDAARYVQHYLRWCRDQDAARAYAVREAERVSDYLVGLVSS